MRLAQRGLGGADEEIREQSAPPSPLQTPISVHPNARGDASTVQGETYWPKIRQFAKNRGIDRATVAALRATALPVRPGSARTPRGYLSILPVRRGIARRIPGGAPPSRPCARTVPRPCSGPDPDRNGARRSYSSRTFARPRKEAR